MKQELEGGLQKERQRPLCSHLSILAATSCPHGAKRRSGGLGSAPEGARAESHGRLTLAGLSVRDFGLLQAHFNSFFSFSCSHIESLLTQESVPLSQGSTSLS